MAILAIMKKKTRGLISISREIHIYVEESFVLEIYIISLHAPYHSVPERIYNMYCNRRDGKINAC